MLYHNSSKCIYTRIYSSYIKYNDKIRVCQKFLQTLYSYAIYLFNEDNIIIPFDTRSIPVHISVTSISHAISIRVSFFASC